MSFPGKKYFMFYISFPHYSTPFSPYKPFVFSYAYYKNNLIYNFSLSLFLLSLLQSFNFIYSYVPLCLWVFSLLNLWLLFAVRHFVMVFAAECHAMYYPLGHNVNVQKQFFFYIFFLHFYIPFPFTQHLHDFSRAPVQCPHLELFHF